MAGWRVFGGLALLVAVAAAIAAVVWTNVRPRLRSREALREWGAATDGEVVGERARLKARGDVEALYDTHGRVGFGWAARASGLGISGTTTLWIERRRKHGWMGGFRTDDADFDGAFFITGDGGDDLEQVLRLDGFREAVLSLFARVSPAAVEIDVDGNLIVRTGRPFIDVAGTRTLLDATAAFADALAALAHEVKMRSRALAAGAQSISVGGESGAPMPVPARRA